MTNNRKEKLLNSENSTPNQWKKQCNDFCNGSLLLFFFFYIPVCFSGCRFFFTVGYILPLAENRLLHQNGPSAQIPHKCIFLT